MAKRKIVTVDSMEETLPKGIKYSDGSEIETQIKAEVNKRSLAPGTTLTVRFDGAWVERPTNREDITVQWLGGLEKPVSMLNGDIWFMEIEGSDTEPPTIPSGLMASDITPTGFTVSWNSSTDTKGVTGYEVFLGGTLKSATTSTEYSAQGLNSNTSYSVTVRAVDASGNFSAFSEPLNVTTLEPIQGDNHSIFGDGVPSAALTSHTDGNPSIVTATGFYTTGNSQDWNCVGGRQYVPAGSDLVGKTLTIGLFRGGQTIGDTLGPNLSSAPERLGTVTAVAGWNEVTWEPYTLFPGLPAVYVSSTVGDNSYVAAKLTEEWSIPSPTSGGRLHLAETGSLQVTRSAFKLGDATEKSTSWYGQDILVSGE